MCIYIFFRWLRDIFFLFILTFWCFFKMILRIKLSFYIDRIIYKYKTTLNSYTLLGTKTLKASFRKTWHTPSPSNPPNEWLKKLLQSSLLLKQVERTYATLLYSLYTCIVWIFHCLFNSPLYAPSKLAIDHCSESPQPTWLTWRNLFLELCYNNLKPK